VNYTYSDCHVLIHAAGQRFSTPNDRMITATLFPCLLQHRVHHPPSPAATENLLLNRPCTVNTSFMTGHPHPTAQQLSNKRLQLGQKLLCHGGAKKRDISPSKA